MKREKTKVVHIGNRAIGGGNPIAIQSNDKYKNRRRAGYSGTDISAGSKGVKLSAVQFRLWRLRKH